MFRVPPDHRWEYLEGQVYRCKECDREVYYPDTLRRDGRCTECHACTYNPH